MLLAILEASSEDSEWDTPEEASTEAMDEDKEESE